jgi:hypothetical protein
VFKQRGGSAYNSSVCSHLLLGRVQTTNDITYHYPGVVSNLAEEGKISSYLAPYHTRHTFITLMAHADTDLLLLAAACGNSIEVIRKHYLGFDKDVEFPDI